MSTSNIDVYYSHVHASTKLANPCFQHCVIQSRCNANKSSHLCTWRASTAVMSSAAIAGEVSTSLNTPASHVRRPGELIVLQSAPSVSHIDRASTARRASADDVT